MEYEVLGIVAIITGLFSVQIKVTYDKLKEKMDLELKHADEIHKKVFNEIEKVKNQIIEVKEKIA